MTGLQPLPVVISSIERCASMGEATGDTPREVLFEFTVIGSSVRVAAIDPLSGIEVTVVGPRGAARADLERLALAKLKARIGREGMQP